MKAEILGPMRRFLYAGLAFAAHSPGRVAQAHRIDGFDRRSWPRQIQSARPRSPFISRRWTSLRESTRRSCRVAVRDSSDAQPEFGVVCSRPGRRRQR